jgi:hypothetical protein
MAPKAGDRKNKLSIAGVPKTTQTVWKRAISYRGIETRIGRQHFGPVSPLEWPELWIVAFMRDYVTVLV